MKPQHNKIQAFTLSEMIIVLILTSIVVGLAFTVLNLVQKHMISIQHNYTSKTELNKLETALWLDFNKYSEINFDNIENELQFKTEIDSVTYQFLETKIVKNRDTFPIILENKTLFFDGQVTENGQIDAIKLKTVKEKNHQLLFVFKQNDATAYLK